MQTEVFGCTRSTWPQTQRLDTQAEAGLGFLTDRQLASWMVCPNRPRGLVATVMRYALPGCFVFLASLAVSQIAIASPIRIEFSVRVFELLFSVRLEVARNDHSHSWPRCLVLPTWQRPEGSTPGRNYHGRLDRHTRQPVRAEP